MRRAMLGVLGLVALAMVGSKERKRSPLHELARVCHDDDAEMSCARPIFNVSDLRASQRYYRDVLGFKIDWEDGDPPDFTSVSRANAVLFMCQHCQGTPGAWSMVIVRDVDALHREITARRALIRMPPRDMPWHLREMHVSDLDGNVIRFGSGIEHDD
jgi:catechol 2,3-dioxygenase-like lactoylglutathione lyase family enzyme